MEDKEIIMQKEEITKEDGRYLIFYTFPESDDEKENSCGE